MVFNVFFLFFAIGHNLLLLVTQRILEFGVPLGLILGPLLITLYTADIQDKISAHNLDCMFYSNDSQLYIDIDPLNWSTSGRKHPSEVY